jgi:hypothetical protein
MWWQWVLDHKELLFSGVAGTAAVAFVGFFLKKLFERKPVPAPAPAPSVSQAPQLSQAAQISPNIVVAPIFHNTVTAPAAPPQQKPSPETC